jgi:primary-amine oxidase
VFNVGAGILNIYVLGEGEEAGPSATEVAPRVTGHAHQHLFSLRIDSMVDGVNNSIVETDIVPMEAPTGSKENWAGS